MQLWCLMPALVPDTAWYWYLGLVVFLYLTVWLRFSHQEVICIPKNFRLGILVIAYCIGQKPIRCRRERERERERERSLSGREKSEWERGGREKKKRG